jgi:hypothetical protein
MNWTSVAIKVRQLGVPFVPLNGLPCYPAQVPVKK